MLRETIATASTPPAPPAATAGVSDAGTAEVAEKAPPETVAGSGEGRPSRAGPAVEAGRPAEPPPDRDEAVLAWAEEVLPSLPKGARALLAGGRFLPNTATALRLGVPTPGFLARCEPHRADVEAAFGRYFDRSVTVEFVRDDGTTTGPPTAREGVSTAPPLLGEIVAAASRPARRSAEVDRSGVEQVQQAFPGARLIELETSP